jgi:hypothetical protein
MSSPNRVMKRFHKGALVICVVVIALGSLYFIPQVRTWFQIDACLDSGGAWRQGVCAYR